MADDILDWLNNKIKLSKKITNISDDFQNGYLFAELLYKTRQIPNISIYKNSNQEKDIIHNFCFLSKNFLDMKIPLDEISRNNIMKKSPYTAQIYLYKIRQVLDKKLISYDNLRFRASNEIHNLYTGLMFKNDNEKYYKNHLNKLETKGKEDENLSNTEKRFLALRKKFKKLDLNKTDYKLIKEGVKELEYFDEKHNDIHSLENNRKKEISFTEANQIESYTQSMVRMRKLKKWEKDQEYKGVLYYSKATLNSLKKSALDCKNQIEKYEDNLNRLGLNVTQDPNKVKRSHYVSTDIIMMRMKERLNEKMKQKKEMEKRYRRKLKEELELNELKKNKKLLEKQKQITNENEKNDEIKKSEIDKLMSNENIEEKKEETIEEKKEINLEDKKEENEEEKEEENKEIKERDFKTTTSFNFISENSKGMNLIKNSLLLHDQNILVADRITLFQTMIPTFRKDLKKDLIPELEDNNNNNEITKNINNGFNVDEFFKELDQIKSEILTKEIQKKKEKKLNHFNLIKPIIYQIYDIVNEVGKYQIENNIDLIDQEKWDNLTLQLINNEEIDSDKINAKRKKGDADSVYEFDYGDKINKKEEEELYDYCNFIGIWNEKIIPNEMKGYKFNYVDLYTGIYKNNNGIDIKDYEPIPEEIENLCLPTKRHFNPQFGEIIDISLDNIFKNQNKEKNFVENTVTPISKDSLYNYIPIKISMLGSPLSGKKTQSNFLKDKYKNLKIYNLEEILYEIVEKYDELKLPIEENPRFKAAKKNQIDQIREEIEKEKENLHDIEEMIRPYLELRDKHNEKLEKEKLEKENQEKENKEEEKKEDKNDENKNNNNNNNNKDNNDNININEKIEIPDHVLLDILVHQLHKDFPSDLESRYNLISGITNKYLKYKEILSNEERVMSQIKEEEEKEKEEDENNKKAKKPNPTIVNLQKDLQTIKTELNNIKPDLYVGFILINFPHNAHQANELEKYVTGYISEFDKPLDEKENKLFSYSNLIDIPLKKSSNQELIHSSLDVIFNLNIDNEENLRRFNGLRYDPKENKIYHIDVNPPNPNDKKLNERLENVIPGLSENDFNYLKDLYERNINDLNNFYKIMGNGRVKTFNNIDQNNREYLKKENDEINILVDEVMENFYSHIEEFMKSVQSEKDEEEKRKKEEEERKKREEERRKKEEEERKKREERLNKINENEENEDESEQSNVDSINGNFDYEAFKNKFDDIKMDDNENDNFFNSNSSPITDLKVSMRTGPNYEMIIMEIDELNTDYQNCIKNFMHFISRQKEHIINHLNSHQNSFITFLNRPTNKKELAQVYLNKYNTLLQNYPNLKNNLTVSRELMNDITIINAQLWNCIQLKKTEDVEKLESFQNDGYKEKEINSFYKYIESVFIIESKKYLFDVNVVKQYYLYSSHPDESKDFFVDFKNIISGDIKEEGNIMYKIKTLFKNSLILIIRQDEKINMVIEEYKNNLKINPQSNQGQNQIRTFKRLNSGHSQRSTRSKARKKAKNTNLLNNTFNIIEEEFKNQIKSEKNKFKYKVLLLKYFSEKYIKNIYKVFDDTYVLLDDFIIDSVKKQNVVLNEFIEYLKSCLNRFVNVITFSDFEFDSFDIYEKYKLKIEDYFKNKIEEEDEKIEIKKFHYSVIDLYNLYLQIKNYSSESIDYLVKTNIVKEILIKKYFIDSPLNNTNKAINQKIKELTFENYDYFFSLFEEYDGRYVNINEMFTTLMIIGSNVIKNEKWKEIATENILRREDFLKIHFGFEKDTYLNKPINEEEEKEIKDRGENFTKVDLVKNIIFDIYQVDEKIDMRKLEKMFKIINGEIIKERKKDEDEFYNVSEYEDKEEENIEEHEKEKNNILLNKDDFLHQHEKNLKENEINKNEDNGNKIENNKINSNNNLIEIIREDESDESSHSISDSEEGKPRKKNQKIKLSENKNLIYNLVFGLINNQDE